MQRQERDGVVLACDFCGTDWDMVRPMIEGHRGSILCLDCLARAIDEAAATDGPFDCTLCLRHFDAGERAWRHADAPETAKAEAIVCFDCLQQADRAFAKDPDTPWERRIEADERWK